jgi:hypothetical protein
MRFKVQSSFNCGCLSHHSFNSQPFQFSNFQIFKLILFPFFKFLRLPKYLIPAFSNFQIFKFSNFQIKNLLIFQSFNILIFQSSFSQIPYFQQTVNYKIEVTLNDIAHELNAFETIEYQNNSGAELKEIYFHLWPNAYKNTSTAFAKQQLELGETKYYYSKEEERGYIDQLDFRVNGQNVNWVYDSVHIDICKIILNAPLKAGEKITISTPFHVKIPNTFSRLGHNGQSYQITQWYPKPAVYDRYGWHPMPYLAMGEFYSEFGMFDVYITIPRNYVIGATGDLVNGEDEIIWLDEKAKTTALIQNYNEKDMEFPLSDNKTKTLHYHQENVHDFAWFADKRFHVLKGEVELPHSKKKVTTWAMYTNTDAYLWKNAIQYINDAIYYYSLWNGDYPYNQATALESALSAGGGMEYPNVTVIGSSETAFGLETLIVHEVGHNWFYGILGSNERDHAWMDEGINSYNESRYVSIKHPEENLLGTKSKILLNVFRLKDFKHKVSYYTSYLYSAKLKLDQPLNTPSPKYWPVNYGSIVYCKSAIIFDYLRAYLNTAEMDNIMQKYFQEWKFKHPYPDDLKNTFTKSTGKNLDWFFEDMIKTSKKLDYKIINKKTEGDSIKITIKNTGDIESPIVVGAMEKKTPIQLKWIEGFSGKQTISFPKKYYDLISSEYLSGVVKLKHPSSFKIDPLEVMPEINRNNNTLRNKGLCKKIEPLQLQLIGSLNNPNKTQIFYVPVVGWNYHNGFMPGIAIYNHFIFPKPVQINFMPLYSTKTNSLAGNFKIAFNSFFSSRFFIHSIKSSYAFSRYAFANDDSTDYFYEKNELKFEINFRKKHPQSSVEKSLVLRNILLSQLPFYENTPYILTDYYSAVFNISDKRRINPWSLKLNLEPTSAYLKGSIEAIYKISFKGKNKGIDLRLFAGKFLYQSSEYYGNYNFRMSGWSGYRDYLYEHVFLSRYISDQNTLSQQFVETEGAFKVYTPVGESNNWISAFNIKLFPPFKLPIGLFADFGYSPTTDNKLMYDVGIQFALIRNVIDIYIPIKVSQNIQDAFDANGLSFGQTIRFTLNLSGLNLEDFAVNSLR